MRILFTPWAWSPHYFPMVPIAWALRNAGHEVRVASSPSLVDTITDSGLPAVSVGADIDFVACVREHMGVPATDTMTAEAWRELRRRKGPKALQMFVKLAEAMADDLIDFARAWQPDLVVHTPSGFIGPVVAAAVGVPNVRHLKVPDIAAGTGELERQLLAPLCARHGIEHIEPLGSLTLDPCPEPMRTPVDYPYQPIRYIPYNGSGTVPEWLLEPVERRRVCVTWGTTLGKLHPGLMLGGQMVEAAAGLDVEVVAAMPADFHDRVDATPQNVRLVSGLPLHLLLQSCSAIIHQGGAGTTMTSVVAGVPQLVVPQFPEQVFNAGRVVAGGGGIAVMPEDAGVEAVRAGLEELLDKPDRRQSARDLAAQANALPIPPDVVEVLERLAAGETPRGERGEREHGEQGERVTT
jgi:UDP:flavonoid glycosyltransferase YjiC (YdhE family)